MSSLTSLLREVTFWLILAAAFWIMGFSARVTPYYTAKEG
jgi:hypothetical protein